MKIHRSLIALQFIVTSQLIATLRLIVASQLIATLRLIVASQLIATLRLIVTSQLIATLQIIATAQLIAMFLIFCPTGHAEIVIQSPTADSIEFAAFLQTHPDKRAIATEQLRQLRVKAPVQDLKQTLARAQDQFLHGNISEARSQFEKILSMRTYADWSDEDRQAIQYAALRLAQMSKVESQDRFLEIAASLNTKMLDVRLFPPPLVERFKSIVANGQTTQIHLALMFPGFTDLLVDGRRISFDTQQTIRVDDLEHRFTWIGNAYEAHTWIGKWDQLSLYSVPLIPLVTGTCEEPNFHSSVAELNVAAYFGMDCPLATSDVALSQLRPKLKAGDFQSLKAGDFNSPGALMPTHSLALPRGALTPNQPIALPNAFKSSGSRQLAPAETKSWIKSNWMWLTLGVTAVSAAIIYDSQRDNDRHPTTTVGF